MGLAGIEIRVVQIRSFGSRLDWLTVSRILTNPATRKNEWRPLLLWAMSHHPVFNPPLPQIVRTNTALA